MFDGWLLFPSSFNVRICISRLTSTFVGWGTIVFEFVSSLIGSRFVWNTRVVLFETSVVDWTCEDVRERELGFVGFSLIEGNGLFDNTFGNLNITNLKEKTNFYFSVILLIRH